MYRLSSAQFYIRPVYTSSATLTAYSVFYASSPFCLRFTSLLSRRVSSRSLCDVRTKYLYVAAGISTRHIIKSLINPLKPELNPICYLLALLAHHFLHVSRIRVKSLTLRLLMLYIYMEHLFLMFLDHTQRRSTVGRTPLDE